MTDALNQSPTTAAEHVTVTVSGPTGVGKSHVAAEIEVALKALGATVTWERWQDKREADHEMWVQAQMPTHERPLPPVVIREVNEPRKA